MKIHISNIYNIALSDRVKLQHKIAKAGHALGMYELGIFSYPVDGDTLEQLSTRLDGLVSSLEQGDRVILQLPTGNGREFEEKLAGRIFTYTGHYPMLLVNGELGEEYHPMLNLSERIMTVTSWLYGDLKDMLKREASQKLIFHFTSQETSLLDDQAGLMKLVDGLNQLPAGQDAIQVCFAIHDNDGNYSSRVAVAMLSIMRKTRTSVFFHILLDDSVDAVNRRRLSKVARENGAGIRFYMMDNAPFERLAEDTFIKIYSYASLYRLFVPDLLKEINRIIYLDADVMVNCDLAELWNLDLHGKELGAVVDEGIKSGTYYSWPVRQGLLSQDQYFNSGVLMMDLKQIRQGANLWDEFRHLYPKIFGENSDGKMPDQDILNLIFKDRTFYLAEKWNTLTRNERTKNTKLKSAIYHFAGDKYINYQKYTEYDQLYLELREEVPWEKSVINGMFIHLLRLDEYKIEQLQKLASRLIAKPKKLIFYGNNQSSMKALYEILKPKGDDYFIEQDIMDQNGKRFGLPVRDFSSLASEKPGTFIVIVLPDADHGQAVSKLDSLNLKNGVDYFVAPTLTSGDQGGYIW